MGISILSYAGQVRIGILGDEGLLADPGTLLDAFEAELDLLLARALELEEPTS